MTSADLLMNRRNDEQTCTGDNVKMNEEHFVSSHVTNNNVGHKELDTKTTTPTEVDAHTKEQVLTQQPANSTQKSVIILLVIFVISLMSMMYIYMMFPELEESEKQHVKIPFDIEDAKQLGLVLDRYKDEHYLAVMFAIMIVYIFLQTFAIPGSLFLSILSGFLFNFGTALGLTCFCSALGATLCYTLSQLVGRRLVKHYFPDRAAIWSIQVEKHRDDLLSYMLFLRMTPFLPNWFINLVAPVIGVPLKPFAVGTFFGVAPPSFIAIQTGKTLYKLTSSTYTFSWSSMLILAVFSLVSLVPVIFKKYFKSKID